jgi:multidrug efflux pump subunit AcrA (membrane-fusion protein)
MSSRTSDQVSGGYSSGESQGPDDEAIRRAKLEIQSLVQEVVDLSKSQIDPTEFYAALLEKSISALAAIGGVVWTIEEGGPFKLEYQVNIQQTGLIESPEAQARHGRLLGQIVKRGEATLVAPRSGAGLGDDESAANPTDYLLVIAPIVTERGVDGLVEIFQRTGARPNTQRGYLRFLSQICELAAEYLKTRRLRDFGAKQTLWEQLESFTSLVHEKLDSRSTSYTIANEGRRLIGCDRVTVVLKKGPKSVVEAISGQDTFDKRSNVVRMLRDLAAVVIRSGEDLWYTGDTTNLSPQVERAVNDYVDESHTKQIAVLPLREADPHSDDPNRPKRRENMLGAIVIEQLVDSRAPEGMLQRVDVVRRHSSTALTNAQSHEGLFLLPLWRMIGRSRVLVTARNLPKTVLASILLVAAIAAMWLVRWDFTITADGKLLPELRAFVFAAQDGIVAKTPVDEGDLVQKGAVVAEQRNPILEQQMVELEGRIEENLTRQDGAMRQLDAAQRDGGSREPMRAGDVNEVSSEIVRLENEEANLRSQLAILETQKDQLTLTSPIDGKIVTWQVRDLIRNRPVRTGTRLMEVADPMQNWELQVDVPESKVGHIVRRLQDLQRENPDAALDVTFMLATNTGAELRGRVTHIDSSAEVLGEAGNCVRMEVAFPQEELLVLMPGATDESIAALKADPAAAAEAIEAIKMNLKVGAGVKAKIHCGRRAIGYVWFHELWEFIQSRILFRF